jgi:hypothetical protein
MTVYFPLNSSSFRKFPTTFLRRVCWDERFRVIINIFLFVIWTVGVVVRRLDDHPVYLGSTPGLLKTFFYGNPTNDPLKINFDILLFDWLHYMSSFIYFIYKINTGDNHVSWKYRYLLYTKCDVKPPYKGTETYR